MITVLVVDDHELVRTGICRMLEDHANVQVIGQAYDEIYCDKHHDLLAAGDM